MMAWQVVQALLAGGASTSIVNKEGQTASDHPPTLPLTCAVEDTENDSSLAQYLVCVAYADTVVAIWLYQCAWSHRAHTIFNPLAFMAHKRKQNCSQEKYLHFGKSTSRLIESLTASTLPCQSVPAHGQLRSLVGLQDCRHTSPERRCLGTAPVGCAKHGHRYGQHSGANLTDLPAATSASEALSTSRNSRSPVA